MDHSNECATLKAVIGKFSKTVTERELLEIDEQVMTIILLNLSGNLAKELRNEKTTKDTWGRLISKYLTKSLPNRIL